MITSTRVAKTAYDCPVAWGKSKIQPEEMSLLDGVSPQVRELLDAMDLASVLFAPGDIPVYFSKATQSLGIIRDQKVVGEELLALIRVVRRTKVAQSGQVEIPLGPIGQGTRLLSVNVTPFGGQGLLLGLFRDESEAARIDAVRRDFVANISHELKTPIGALSLLSEAVLEASTSPDDVARFARRMQLEAKRLSDLVQEIINLSRLQDADPLLDALVVDVDDMVASALHQASFSAETREIELVRGPQVGVSVDGDRKQLIMAVHNLLENAINYSPSKTKVTLNTVVVDGIVEISVIDQGIGIDEKDTERIFERFYRVDPARSRDTGGTGLGLSIVKHVALNHGGTVSVWSSPGVGSTFTIKLPVRNNANSTEDTK